MSKKNNLLKGLVKQDVTVSAMAGLGMLQKRISLMKDTDLHKALAHIEEGQEIIVDRK